MDEVLKDLIDFSKGEITKENLIKNSKKKLYEFIDYGVIQSEQVIMYSILCELVGIGDLNIQETFNTIKNYIDILIGRKNASFKFMMMIDKKFVTYDLCAVENVFCRYYSKKKLQKNDIERIVSFIRKKPQSFNTVKDILKFKIIEIIDLVYWLDNGEIEFDIKSTLFMTEAVADSLEERIKNKIFDLFDCYNGRKEFVVHVVFDKGMHNIYITS